MGADEKIYEVAGRACDLGLDGIGEISNRISEGQAAGVYRAGIV